jgi:hypothetical protein
LEFVDVKEIVPILVDSIPGDEKGAVFIGTAIDKEISPLFIEIEFV